MKCKDCRWRHLLWCLLPAREGRRVMDELVDRYLELLADVAALRAELRERAEALDELADGQPFKQRNRYSSRYFWTTLDLPSTAGGDWC